jgi:hypothetical protein
MYYCKITIPPITSSQLWKKEEKKKEKKRKGKKGP